MNEGPAPAILASGLTKRFGQVTAVAGLSLEVQAGEIFGLVGPDGAGKTTTLRMLAGIMTPSEGTGSLAGFEVTSQPDQVKDCIAYMSQRFGLYVDLTVQENIDFYADLYGVPRQGRTERIDRLLDFSAMRPFKKRRAGDLSGGMKQKLQLVCALIHTPQVLLLDEPTNGVDPVSRRDFWRILYRLAREGVAILVTTAYLDEAERCSRIGLLDQGRLLIQGSPGEIRRHMKDSIVAVHSPEARRVARVLQRAMDKAEINLFGDSVHITTRTPEPAVRAIQTALAAAALPAEEIRVQPPSLEDVFVNLLAGSGHISSGPAATSAFTCEPASSTDIDSRAVWVEDLTRRFGRFTAVNQVSFAVRRGEIFGFLGPNGAGKSTCIRMLCGLLAPSEGRGSVAGFDITTQPEHIKQHIGYMSQKFSLYSDLTVEENIDFYGGTYGLDARQLARRKSWAIDMTGLHAQRHSLSAILSVGWKQRLAMACAVLHEPPIVFLDEPTSGADPISRRRFWDLIYAMAEQGVTVFVTTHYMEEAEYCDRLAMISGGAIIAMGTPRELKRSIMHETILNIICPRPQDIIEEIATLPGVKEVALFGAGLHAVVQDSPAAMAAIQREFARRGHDLMRIEPAMPDMEDVFVRLAERVVQ
jgi:ABC-2 type transport system ATP-binding protein